MTGLEYLAEHEENSDAKPGDARTSMIIFLTDGEPTTGITSNQQIIHNAKSANECKYRNVCVCVCVCVLEREREREDVCVRECVCV